jgi:hypothetical protein
VSAHPEVKAAADAALAQPVIISIISRDDKLDGTVDDTDRKVAVQLPNGGGRVQLSRESSGRSNGSSPSIFSGVSSQGERIAATAAQLNALPKAAAPSADAVHEFVTEDFINSRAAAPPPIEKWSEKEAFNYLASNPEIIKTVGLSPEAALAHRNAFGRFEGRPERGVFNVDAYLTRRPDVRRAAIVALGKPQIVGGSNSSITLALPNGGGSVRLTQAPAAGGAFTGVSSKGAQISMSLAELDALRTRPTQDDVRAFAIKQYVTAVAARHQHRRQHLRLRPL